MGAMWDFINREGYNVDIGALHRSYPDIAWTTFAAWAAGDPAIGAYGSVL
jgi:hypothetical protein